MLQDILMTRSSEKGEEMKYSQSRIYLLVCLTILLGTLVTQLFVDLNSGSVATATDNLYYLVLIFSGYALGEKVSEKFTKREQLKN